MLVRFGAENQVENCFFLASISCVFCVLDFSIETLLNLNRGAGAGLFIGPADRKLPGEVGRPLSGISPLSIHPWGAVNFHPGPPRQAGSRRLNASTGGPEASQRRHCRGGE